LTEAKRILIVDDEELARRRVARYLHDSGGVFEIAEANSGLEAVALIESFKPEIVFLDIEMPGLDGFEVLAQFSQRPFHVIFQTGYDEFAIRAFEEHACDYLLKPFSPARLAQALRRALGRLDDEERLRALEAQFSSQRGHLRRLTIKQGRGWRIVGEEEVVCFVSRDHYTCAHFIAGGNHYEGIVDLSLTELRARLDPQVFRQFHRRHLVRIAAIKSLLTGRDGEWRLEMSNGMRLEVARRSQREAKEVLSAERRRSGKR
jgi:two-component system LytT family response regulator